MSLASRMRLGGGILAGLVLALVAAQAQLASPPVAPPRPVAEAGPPLRLKFNSAPIDLVLQDYAEQTGRTLLLAPSLPTANITLRSQTDLSLSEYLDAIEAVLSMNGISLLKEGEKFVRVVPNAKAREEPAPLRRADSKEPAPEGSAMISQMIALKYIESAEAIKSIQPLLHSYVPPHAFEGINNILITDTAANINRIMQVIGMIDQPVEAREEPIIVQIHYAKASEIKVKLEEIIAESQGEQKSTVQRQRESGAPGVDASPMAPALVPGVIRARRAGEAAAGSDAAIAEAERGIIRGQVKIVDDDRTNILIILTRPENMSFFEKVIQVLDVETAPDVLVKVFRLESAIAKDIAGMLNDLIGASTTKDDAKSAPGATPGATPEAVPATGGGEALRAYVQRREAAASSPAEPGKSKVGRLSTENVKILSDERTNSLIIMASKSDIAALQDIIRDMDIMLSQVLIEVVILSVTLSDELQTGVDWVQRALVSYNEGPNGTLQPKAAFAGAGGGGSGVPIGPTALNTADSVTKTLPQGGGLTYFLTLFDLNMDAVFHAVARDSRSRVLSSPVILTTDNKQAKIEVTSDVYFFKGQKPVQSGTALEYVDDVDRQKVGIKLSVTPRINEKKFVSMEIAQSIEDANEKQPVNGTLWPIVSSRTLEAEVAVSSGETIVLGGLVKNTDTKAREGIPFLADIPILGMLFRSDTKNQKREEVIVFLTPYVMNTPKEIEEYSARREGAAGAKGMWKQDWSNSKLAEPRTLGQLQERGSNRLDQGYSPDKRARIEKGPTPFVATQDSLLGNNRSEPTRAPVTTASPAASPTPAVVPTAQGSGQAGGQSGDPMQSLDPDLRKYVEQEDQRWKRPLEKVDQKVNVHVGSAPR